MNIQALIDAVSAAGGGRAVVPPGIHEINSSLLLKDNVELHLAAGAVIRGRSEIAVYPLPPDALYDGAGQTRGRALIQAVNAVNIAITGEGCIDGNGREFDCNDPLFCERPLLLRLSGCRDVRISGVFLRDSAAWCCHLHDCEGVNIHDININNHANHNNDGIDIDSCRKVEITNCDIDTDDDSICLKSTAATPCEDINISHCRLKSNCGAIKFGTESYGDIRRVTISDCRIENARLGAVKILSMDGAVIEDIRISELEIISATTPIFLRLGNRGRVYDRACLPKPAGAIRRISICNIRGRIDSYDWNVFNNSSFALNPALVSGIPGACIEDLHMENISLSFPGRGVCVEDEIPENPAHYPEIGTFGELPASCFFLRHVRNFRASNFRITVEDHDQRPSLVLSDVQNVELSNISLPE